MSTPDVVPVAWIGDVQRAYLQSGTDRFGVVSNVRNHGDALYSQATVDALQSRIAPDVVPVAWVNVVDTYEGPYDFYGVVYLPTGKTNLYSQATVDAMQARIDELEAQLFIAKADAALPLYEAMGFGPMPAFPSIRGA